MANNRLYLYDPVSGEAFLLATSLGDGWVPARRQELDDLMGRLGSWLQDRDCVASWGNCFQGRTVLRLMTEADLPMDARLMAEGDG